MVVVDGSNLLNSCCEPSIGLRLLCSERITFFPHNSLIFTGEKIAPERYGNLFKVTELMNAVRLVIG